MARVAGWQKFLLVVVLLLGGGVRLLDISDAPLEFHPVRQLRSALIARAIYYRLNTAADPQVRQDAISLAGLEVYEPPILEGLVGTLYFLSGGEQIAVARVVNTIFWLVGGLALFWLMRRAGSFPAALIGLCFYLFLPFSIIASRSFQPDPWMVMWILLFTAAAVRWSETLTPKWALLAGLAGGMAVLVKAFAGFFVFAVLGAVVLAALGLRRALRSPQVWGMGIVAALPALIYYGLILRGRSSGFFSFWTVSMSKLLLSTNFYADWLAMVGGLMGLTVVLAALIGTALAPTRVRAALLGLWIGYGLFGLSSPYQYTTHEYYHLALVPLVALGITPLLKVALDALGLQPRVWRALALGAVAFAAFYGLYVGRSQLVAQNFRGEEVGWKKVGEALPVNHSFIALTADYGMRLRYFGWRTPSAFWPSTADLKLSALHGSQAEDMQQAFKEATTGQDYFLVTAFNELDAQPELKQILAGYPLYAEGNGYQIYDLTRPQ